jgi:hypothetical protein
MLSPEKNENRLLIIPLSTHLKICHKISLIYVITYFICKKILTIFYILDTWIFWEKTGISNTRTSKKKRGHRNGNIEKLLKSGEL